MNTKKFVMMLTLVFLVLFVVGCQAPTTPPSDQPSVGEYHQYPLVIKNMDPVA